MDILIPTKQRQLDAKLKDFTEDSGSTSAFLMCVYSEVFTSSERSFLTVFTPILWYIDVYKEIFVLWHCVIMLFLINSVYIQSVYIHNLFSMMRGFLQYNTRANLRILWSFGVVTQNTHTYFYAYMPLFFKYNKLDSFYLLCSSKKHVVVTWLLIKEQIFHYTQPKEGNSQIQEKKQDGWLSLFLCPIANSPKQ